MKKEHYQFWSAVGVSLYCLATTSGTQAQEIMPDKALSTNVTTRDNLNFTITEGNQVGSNLFHSFSKFSVPRGGSASFAVNDPNVKNIISRVTGGSISNIDGSIAANGSANLFLINPNGIIFGPNASLNIGGSFVASTASSLLFADGTQFSATNPQTPPLLSVSVPIGLQFGNTAKPIYIEGSNLEVPTGKTLALLGGDVIIKGAKDNQVNVLTAPAGRIELGSVAANTLVSLTSITEGWALGYDSVQNFQDIHISQEAVIDTTGEGSGAIQLRGRQIAITGNSQVGGFTIGEQPGQPLVIKASESVEVSGSQINTDTLGTGAASDITIAARRLIFRNELANGTFIGSNTESSGQGGTLTVSASESVEVLGGEGSSLISTQTSETGGNAGMLQITTRQLILSDGGRISSTTFGAGNGGTLKVDASEVEATGRSKDGLFRSGLFVQTLKSSARGNGGELIINTQRLVVQGGASISAAAINGSTGNAGKLTVNASDSVAVIGTGIDEKGKVVPSSLLAESELSGKAGGLSIATGKLSVRDGAEVSVSNTGTNNAGDLTVAANSIFLDNQGKLTASTASGKGGNINLQVRDLILMRRNSLISAEADNNGDGGNITISNSPLIVAVPKENSDIIANAEKGKGGNITITTSGIYGLKYRPQPTNFSSDINASSKFGVNGTVQINTPGIDPSRGLTSLPTNVVNVAGLVKQGCQTGGKNQTDRFVITGKGGLPLSPTEMIDGSTVLDDFGLGVIPRQKTEDKKQGNVQSPTSNPQIVEAQGWFVNNLGQVVLTAQAPSVTPNSSWYRPASCTSKPELHGQSQR